MGIAFLNEAIVSTAMKYNLPIIELKAICCEKSDYANAIEPSTKGGEKISSIILRVIEEFTFADNSSKRSSSRLFY
jgi:hypothetical protein